MSLERRTPLKWGQSAGEFERLASTQTDECVDWPYARTSAGYGAITVAGKQESTHVLACVRRHGQPPTDQHEVAHSCHNRLCMNARHLRWATRAENAGDRLADGSLRRGERCPTSRLTAAQVVEIRLLYASGTVTQRQVAKMYGIAQTTVSGIVRKVRWIE